MKNFIDGFIRFKRDVFPKRKQLFAAFGRRAES